MNRMLYLDCTTLHKKERRRFARQRERLVRPHALVFESSKLLLNQHVACMEKPPPMAVRVDKTVRIHEA